MGLEHVKKPRRRSLLRGAAALAVCGAAVAAFVAFGRTSHARANVPEEAWVPPTKPEKPVKTETPATLASKGKIPGGALSAQITLGQAKLVRGSDGELYLHVGIDATDDAAKKERRPIDFALVLDTSGSMEEENKIVLLRRATKDLMKRLGPEDRVAVVAFSNDARTLFPLSAVGDPERQKAWEGAVDALEPSGGTNLSAGLLAGADELRKAEPRPGSARRIILMTDGLANFGVQEPQELCKLVNGLAHEGFTISAIGLGLEYGEKLLADLADAGGGAFHDAGKGDALARIYEVEVEATRSLVARDARLVISPAPGVSVESVYLWPATTGDEGEKVVSLGDLSAGRHLKAVARLKVATNADASALAVARVALRYDDVRGKKAERVVTESVALAVELVKDEQVATASRAGEIKDDLSRVAIADGLQRVHDLTIAGKAEEARVAIARLRVQAGGDTIGFVDAVHGEATFDIRDMEACVAACASSAGLAEKDVAALKRCQAAVAPTGR